jgi:2-(1,2-epoxy-1,2-dihydrophenyl)acetyl-CoA isomerase
MQYKNIRFEKFNKVARITLNRPEVKNALNLLVLVEMANAVEDVMRDDEIKSLVITGTGDTFSSGGDVDFVLNDLCPKSSVEIRNIIKEHYGTAVLSLRNLDKPVVGAINGPALGAGFDLLLHFDIRIASETATFGSIWVKVGIIPALGGMFLLPKIIGLGRASEMILTGDIIDAQEAFKIGLVNKVVPAEQLQEEVMDFAARLSNGPPLATSIAKQGINRSLSGHLSGELDWAASMQSICFKTEDCREGIMAFKERRKPKFQGK